MFRRLILWKAGRSALRAGDITRDEWRVLRGVLWRPKRRDREGKMFNVLDELEQDIAKMSGLPQGAVVVEGEGWAFDWNVLLDWLKDNLAIIVEMIRALLNIFMEGEDGD